MPSDKTPMKQSYEKLIRPLTSSLPKTQVIKTTCETHKGDETAKFGTWEHLQDK